MIKLSKCMKLITDINACLQKTNNNQAKTQNESFMILFEP